MKALSLFALCLVGSLCMAQDVPNIELEEYWFVFFVRGENKETLPEEAMTGHLGNLTRLVEEGKAVAAGPFEGTQEKRGIVILKVDKLKTKDAVVKEFANDPFVKADKLRVQVFKWMTPKGSVKKWREPEEMKPYVFLILETGENTTKMDKEEADNMQMAHLGHIFGLIDKGELGFAGPFADGGAMRGLGFFKHGDVERAKKAFNEDPLVKAGRLKATYLVLWMAAGIVGD